MREIKFRCWCMNKKEWEVDMMLLTLNGGICQLKNGVHIPCRSDTHVLMQFTGLKDKNGKEIYEGDIIEHQYGISTVEYQEDGFKLIEGGHFSSAPLVYVRKTLEVIGNIWENPELLSDLRRG